jgi:hypothetical protein
MKTGEREKGESKFKRKRSALCCLMTSLYGAQRSTYPNRSFPSSGLRSCPTESIAATLRSACSINSSLTLKNGPDINRAQEPAEKIHDRDLREEVLSAGAETTIDSRPGPLAESDFTHTETEFAASDQPKTKFPTFLSRGRAAHWLQTEIDSSSPVMPPPISIPSALSQLLHEGRAAHWRCTETP